MAQQVVTELVIDADTSGADRFETAMNRAGGSADRSTISVQQLSLAIAGVGVALTAAIVGLRSFIDFVGNQSQALVDMAEHARLAGLSTREFQQTLFAARSAGLTETDFVSGLDKITANMTAAGRGVTEFGRLFEANGVSIRKANGELKTGGEALADLAKLMQNASPQIQQAMAKIAGLSASWIPMLRQGVDGIEAQKKAAADLGVIIDDDIIAKAREFNAQWKQAVATWDLQFKASIASIMPLLIKLANIASSIIESVGGIANTLFRVTTPDSEKTSSQVNDQINEVQRLIELMQKYGEMPERLGTLGSFRSMQVYNLKGALGLPEDADFKRVFAYLDELTRRYDELQKKRVLLPTSGGTTVLPAATEATRSALDGEIDRLEKHIALLQADTEAVGQSEAARAGLRAEAALYAAAERSGFKDMERFAEQFHAIREAVEGATAALAKARVASDIKFGKQTIGLSQEDVQIAQALRGIYPDVATALGSVEANMMRLTNAQKMLADGFREVGKEIFSAFLTGKNVMDAMVRSLDSLASKLANSAFDNILSGLMTLNPAQAALGAAQAGASALISAFTSDQKANKEVEEAKKRWEAMADQLKSFNRAASGFDIGPLTSELENLRQVHDTLAMAALEARDYAALDQIHETLNRGIRRVFGEWMNGIPVLGDLSQKIQDLRNEAQGLKDVIPEAAAAIDQGLIARIRQATEEAERGLTADINSARGMDWLNEAGAAIVKFNDLAGKVDPTLLNTWFVVNAQKIIDSSQLTGDAFQRLVDQLSQAVPGIAESLHEFTDAIVRTAAEIAKVKQSFSDQLFVAQQDQNTLAGQLAVFDLQAQRQREEEIKAGGQALAELEALQAQQRYNIIKQYNDKAIDDQKRAAEAQARALEEAQRTFEGFVRNINSFIDHYLSSDQGGLAPADQLANAQSAFNTQLALAQGGNRDALNSITQYFQDLVTANRGYNASSSAGAAIEANALAALQALPAQISPEQFIVNAIEAQTTDLVSSLDIVRAAVLTGDAATVATALVPHFQALLNPTTGLLNQAQLESKLNFPNGSLDKIFKELDGNGDGLLEKSELIKVATQGVKTGTDHLPDVDTNTDSLPAQATKISGMETSLLALAQVSSNTASTANISAQVAAHTLATRQMMQLQNSAWGVQQLTPLAGFAMGTNFAPGGLALVGERGPEIVDLPRGSRVIPNHVAFNDNGYRELVDEVRVLRAEVRRNTQVAASGHRGQIEAAQDGAQSLRRLADGRRLSAARGR